MLNQKTTHWTAVGILSLVYFCLKGFSSAITQYLFDAHQSFLVNIFSPPAELLNLSYFQGMLFETVWAPAQMILTVVIFLLLAKQFMLRADLKRFVLFTFAFLLVVKFEVLFFPPYSDTLTGPFSDAILLVRHDFNYVEYLKQKSLNLYGPKIYPTSLFPTLLALLLKASPNPTVFLVLAHSIILLLGAITVGVFRQLLRVKFTDEVALLGAACLFFFPLFQSMIELLNMEMVCLAFAILTVYWLKNHRFGLATLAAILSLLMKAPGGIACALVLTVAILDGLSTQPVRQKIKQILWGILAVSAGGVKALVRNEIIGEQKVWYNDVQFLGGWRFISDLPYFWIFVASTVILLGAIGVKIFQNRSRGSWQKTLEKERITLMILAMAGWWFALYVNFTSFLYRYELLMLPFFFFSCLAALIVVVRSQQVLKMLLVCVVLFFALNACGRFFYSQNVFQEGGNTYERSLEYRNDLALQQKIANRIEETYASYRIMAPVITAQTLYFHEVGYVSKDLDVGIYGMTSPHEDSIASFTGLKDLDISRTVWVSLNVYQTDSPLTYPVSPYDKILEKLNVGDYQAVIFRGGFAVEKMRIAVKQAYKRRLLGK